MRILQLLMLIILKSSVVLASGPQSTTESQMPSSTSHGFSVFGKLKYKPGFTSYDYVNPNAPKGGEIRIAALGTFDSLNPFIIKGTPAQGVLRCFATLLEQSGDEPASHYGYVAESIEVAQDLSWVVFNLNPNAKFNNGQAITADDVIFSFNALREKGSPMFRTYYKAVTLVEKLSDHQVKFLCPGNKSREIPVILGQLPVLSKAYYEHHAFAETSLTPPVCSGPYEILRLDPGRFITYKRIQNWWGENLPTQKGRHNFNKVKIDYYRDSNAMFEAFKNGQVDVRFENSSKLWATGYDFPAVKQGYVKKQLIKHSLCIPGGQGFFFNTRRDIFSDRRVRQAITEMFDFAWANKNLFYNRYERTMSYFPNTPFEARGLPGAEEKDFLEKYKDQVPSEVLAKEFSLPENKNEQDIRKSRDKALTLLNEAGFEIKGQKLVNKKTGNPFVFETLIADQAMEKIFLHFKGYLNLIGIEMKIRLVDVSTYQQRMDQYDFDMVMSVNPQSPTPGNEQRDMWSSQAASTPGTRNIAGVREKVVDDLIEQLIESHDYKTLALRTRALDRVLLWGYYMVPAWYSGSLPVSYWDRFGRPEITPPYEPFSVETWWLDPNKEKQLPSYSKGTEEKNPANLVEAEDNGDVSWWKKVWLGIRGLFGSKKVS
jgi:microcin C transport system substrate-binding protein